MKAKTLNDILQAHRIRKAAVSLSDVNATISSMKPMEKGNLIKHTTSKTSLSDYFAKQEEAREKKKKLMQKKASLGLL